MLTGLIIQPAANLADALRLPEAQDLISRGAGLYCLNNGSTVLAIHKPANAFAKAVAVRDLDPEVAPCVA